VTRDELEKLADEYFKRAWESNSEEWSPRAAFLAGFRACRDAAAGVAEGYESFVAQRIVERIRLLGEND
jgi:hypothetical protein